MKLFYYKSGRLSLPALFFLAVVVIILLIEGGVFNLSEESRNEMSSYSKAPLAFTQTTPLFEGFGGNTLDLKLSQPTSVNEVYVFGREEMFLNYRYMFDSTEVATINVRDYSGTLLGTVQYDTTSQAIRLINQTGPTRLYLDVQRLRHIEL